MQIKSDFSNGRFLFESKEAKGTKENKRKRISINWTKISHKDAN